MAFSSKELKARKVAREQREQRRWADTQADARQAYAQHGSNSQAAQEGALYRAARALERAAESAADAAEAKADVSPPPPAPVLVEATVVEGPPIPEPLPAAVVEESPPLPETPAVVIEETITVAPPEARDVFEEMFDVKEEG